MANLEDEDQDPGQSAGPGAPAATPDTSAFDPDKALAAVRQSSAAPDTTAFDPDAALSAVRSAQPADLGTVAGQSFAHGAASYPASVVGTPAAVGALSAPSKSAVASGVGDAIPFVGGAVGQGLRAAGDALQPLTTGLQHIADRLAPAPTPQAVGTSPLRRAVATGSEIAGNVATGAALGGVGGLVKGRVLGMGAEDAAADQLGAAKAAEQQSYRAAGPQVLSHPDIDRFVRSSVPEIQDAATAASDALTMRATRLGVTPAQMTNLQHAAAIGDPRQEIVALGLSPQQAQAALAALPNGPTTVDRFDLVRRGVNDAIDATYRRAANGTAAPAEIARARQLRQWVDAVTPIADQQVPGYAAARLAHGTVAGLNNATDYLAAHGGGAGDLANLAGSAAWWAMDPRGAYPAFRTISAGMRLMGRGAEAAKDLTPQGQRLVTAAKWLAAKRQAQAGALRGAVPGLATGGSAAVPQQGQ